MACAGACVAGAAGSLFLPAAVKTVTAVGSAAAALVGVRSLSKRRRNKRNTKKTTKRNKRNKKRNTNRKKRNTKQRGGRQRLLTKRSKK